MNLKVAVVGASGLVGRELVTLLDRAPWRPSEVVALARASTSTAFVEYGDRSLPVDDLRHALLGDFDLVFLAVPAAVARELLPDLRSADVPTVDLSGASVAEGAPWVLPPAFQALSSEAVSIAALPPSAPHLVASVLRPLLAAGWRGEVEALVQLPASEAGRAGMDELSQQVVALMSGGTPPRRVFPDGLAFDLLPALSRGLEDGWSAEESRAAEVTQGLAEGVEALFTLQRGPWFSGVAAQLRLSSSTRLDPGLAQRLLADAGLGVPEEDLPRFAPRPRRAEGRSRVQVGRLRGSEAGRVLFLSAAMDNVRAAATAAVQTGAALLRRRRVQVED